MKRLICILLSCILVISLLPIGVIAASQTMITVSSASANRGDTVNIKVNISSGSGMQACDFELYYDSDVLEVVSATKGDNLTSSPLINTNILGKIVFSYAATSALTLSTTMLNIQFKIKAGAEYGKSDLTLNCKDLSDGNFSGIEHSVKNGYVIVVAPQLEAPYNIEVTKVTDTTVSIYWSSIDEATGYNLYLNGSLINDEPIDENAYELIGLTPDTEYSLQITTMHYTVESEKSELFSLRTEMEEKTVCFLYLVEDKDGIIAYEYVHISLIDGLVESVPEVPDVSGYTFIGWDQDLTNLEADTMIWAKYNLITPTVTFVDYDGTVLKTQTVNYGEAAVPPDVAIRDGYTFTGWDLSFENVTADITVKAMYSDQLCAHEKTSLKNAVPSTCTEHGYGGDVVCDSCGKTIASGDELELLPHFYTDKIIAPQPGIRGYTLHTCTECGHSYKDNYTEYIDPNTPKAVVETKTAAPGDTVTVNISLENAPAVKALTIRDIVYDSEKLELINGKWNINGATIADWNQTDKNAVLAFGHNTDVSGVIFTLTFKVAEGIENANVSVGCKVVAKEKTDNGEETEVSVSVISGAVIISNVKRGDVNGDGYIDSDDAIYMLRYIMMPVEYPINQNGDFNGDGRVNSDDAIYLLYHVLIPDRYELK